MSDPSVDRAAARQILGVVLKNARGSVPMLLGVAALIVATGIQRHAWGASVVVALLGGATVVWRWWLARRFLPSENLSDAECAQVQRQVEGNAALSGLMWTVATLSIYPLLSGHLSTIYVVVVCGSLAVGAYFMALVGRAYLILAVLQLGALVAVSLFGDMGNSAFTLGLLVAAFGFVSYTAAQQFKRLTLESIRHSLQADAANEQLKVALADAEKATLAKTQFLATMSHEIRTPMNGVLGALDLLRRSKLDVQQRRLVRTAASSGESLMSILNDVLDHSKVEAGKLVLGASPLSLRALTESVVALYRANAEAKGLSLELDTAADAPDAVVGDGQRLKQVLLNLVGNAIKFTERGAVVLRLRSASAAPGFVGLSLEVKDSGIGIPQEDLDHLFEPFYQVETGLHRRHGGTGLGLAISQRIVQAMGSRIEVESDPSGGSRFSFSLQLQPAPAEAMVGADSSYASLDDGSTSMAGTVLVVEDNEVNRMIAVEMLRSMGLQALEAGNGVEALEQIVAQPVDVVLMDVQMPVMDGYAATARIREREAKLGLGRLPIVALTANAFDEDAAYALAVGMDAHLAKPYTLQQLRGTLAGCL
jgi:two-component system, sensor histidine kinase